MHDTPAAAAFSTLSGNGKNRSDASTQPFVWSPACLYAISPDSTRFICPAPVPKTFLSLTSTIVLLLVCLATSHATLKSSSCSFVGLAFVGYFNTSGSQPARSRCCKSIPPTTHRTSYSPQSIFALSIAPVVIKRTLCL